MAEVRRERDSVVIPGAEQWRWGGGSGQECSAAAALAAALTLLGEEHYPYHYLMGVSAAAFRIQLHQPNWCPSAPHADCGYPCGRLMDQALPYPISYLSAARDDEEGVRQVRSAVVESLDQGLPAVIFSEEQGLICGYREQGEVFLVRPYAARQDGYLWAADWPWGVKVLGPRQSDRRREPLLLRSFELAVELWLTPRSGSTAAGPGPYACGQAAYQLWLQGLTDAAWVESLTEAARFSAMLANGHCYYCLIDARAAAAGYLRLAADELPSELRPELLAAAAEYELLVQILSDSCPTTIAPMPWMLGSTEAWTPAMRERQAVKLEAALEADAAVMGRLETVLRCAGRPAPAPVR